MIKRLMLLTLVASFTVFGSAPPAALKYRSILTREAHAEIGINAPIPMLAAQIEQESGWRVNVTAWDNGRGLAQFMDGTASDIARLYPELGPPMPYSPLWAIRALIKYDLHIYNRIKGKDACQRWGAALKGYNAGYGYVLQAQKISPDPGIWFELTEYVKTRQSAKNFEYSRLYPRWILFKRQANYDGWGQLVCKERL